MTSALATDPDFVAVAKAIWGDTVDLEELAKALDPSDVHMDGTAQQSEGRKKKLAAGLVTGAVIEGLAAKDTIEPLRAAVQEVRPTARAADSLAGKVKAYKPLVVKPGARIPVQRGAGTNAALQAGNFVVGLGAAKELASSDRKREQVGKALPVRLRPVNPQDLLRRPSLKARPRGKSPAVVAKGDELAADVEIEKWVPEQQQVFGWANVAVMHGQPVVDRQGDVIEIEDLEKAAYDYILDSRIGGDQHRRTPIVKFEGAPLHTADVIESMVFTPEKIEKMGLPADFPQGWWIGMQIHDPEVWELVKSGKRTGFSVHGVGRRVPLEKADESKRVARYQVRERAHQAVHPPAVSRKPVQSSMAASLGYQPQTRRLSVEMKNRPGDPYEYKVKARTAHAVLNAKSTGTAYNAEVKGKAKRVTPGRGYTPADRARLFVHPQQETQTGKPRYLTVDAARRAAA